MIHLKIYNNEYIAKSNKLVVLRHVDFVSPNQASWYAQTIKATYLYITEVALALSHIKADNKTGKLIAYLVTDFMKTNQLK